MFPTGRNWAHGKQRCPIGIFCGVRSFPTSTTTSPTKRKSPRQGQKIPTAPLAAGKSCCRGRRRPSAPLAAEKNSCQGRRKASAPLAAGITVRAERGVVRRVPKRRKEGKGEGKGGRSDATTGRHPARRHPGAGGRRPAEGGRRQKGDGGRRGTTAEGGRQSRAGESRNASKNAGVDAVSEGFEPPVRCRTPVFEAGSFNHSDNSPSNRTTKVGKNLILP